MDQQKVKGLAECHRLLEETGSLDDCLARFPELETEVRAHLALRGALAALNPPEPESIVTSTYRRLLLSSLQSNRASGVRAMPLNRLPRLAGALAGFGLFAIAVLGAGAAPGGVNLPGVGGGRQDGAPTGTPMATAVAPTANGPAIDESETPEATSTPTHGQTVSKAVHDAIASSTPGPARGIAVSEAACTAAHDRSTLPEGAQKAPGAQGRDDKVCTHPNADGTPGRGGNATEDDASPAGDDDNGSGGPGHANEKSNGKSGNQGQGAGHGKP